MRHGDGLFLAMAAVLLATIYQAHAKTDPTYAGIGCYKDTTGHGNRALPTLLANYRTKTDGTMDWNDLENTVIKKCAKKAYEANYMFFGIQFFGECWGGDGRYDRWGKSTRCAEIGGAFVGRAETNFVYMLTGEECSPDTYSVLTEHTRSSSYTGKPRDRPCDSWTNGWQAGWKRFDGAAGQMMANSCVPYRTCGTEHPGWFNGALPEVVEKRKQGRVCFSSKNACCSSYLDITVRNCGMFYVYKLPDSTNGCPKAYCGNGL